MRGSSADERGSIRTWLKTGIDCWILPVTLPLRLYPMVSHFVTRIHATFSILTYIFEAVTKLAQLHKRLHDTSGFHHFPHESMRNSCLDSSARYCEENLSASAQIFVSARAGNSGNSSEKCNLSVSSTVSPEAFLHWKWIGRQAPWNLVHVTRLFCHPVVV